MPDEDVSSEQEAPVPGLPFGPAPATRRYLGRSGGCAIVCVSITTGFLITVAVALIDDLTGILAVSRDAVFIAFVANGAVVAAGAAFGGWASNERVVDRVVFGLLAAGAAVAVYTALFGCFGWVYREYI